jgi:hypothetical protein
MKTEVVLLGWNISIASRRRRRLLVTLLYAACAALVIGVWFPLFKPTWARTLVILWACGLVFRFLGGRNYQGGILPPVDCGDERELHRRNHAYFLAYWWWDFTLLPALLAKGFRINGMPAAWNPGLRQFLYQLPLALLVASGILYYTQPQAILLWTEPDMEQSK